MTRRYLITGGAGFIGSNFARYLLDTDPSCSVTNLDALTYAGVKSTVEDLEGRRRHRFVIGDIRDAGLMERVVEDHDVIVHFAAESHVDRSIDEPSVFLETNFVGTGVILDAARRHGVDRFIHVSTDEVYGSVEEGLAGESFPLNPSSPYSASKAGSDLLVKAYEKTYGYRAIITRSTNNFGPYQFPEKIIPRFITNLIDDQKVPLFGDGRHVRDWLYVRDHCSALALLVEQGVPGETYNIAAGAEMRNIELTRRILQAFDRDDSWIEFVDDRPGHDPRYALDSSRIRSLGWTPDHTFDEWLDYTIGWYRLREDWWRPLKAGR